MRVIHPLRHRIYLLIGAFHNIRTQFFSTRVQNIKKVNNPYLKARDLCEAYTKGSLHELNH